MRLSVFVPLCAFALLSACKTTDAVDGVKSAGAKVADGVGGVATSLIKVDLSNVLNDLALDLKIDRANIPINAQIPITVAANICGVNINILSVSTGGSPNCTATTTSPDLAQAVQQQLAANGSVGGGAQTSQPATTTGTTTTTPATTTTPTTTTTETDAPQQTPQ